MAKLLIQAARSQQRMKAARAELDQAVHRRATATIATSIEACTTAPHKLVANIHVFDKTTKATKGSTEREQPEGSHTPPMARHPDARTPEKAPTPEGSISSHTRWEEPRLEPTCSVCNESARHSAAPLCHVLALLLFAARPGPRTGLRQPGHGHKRVGRFSRCRFHVGGESARPSMPRRHSAWHRPVSRHSDDEIRF